MRLKTQNYKKSIEWESTYSQLQIFYFVTNFCVTVKGLEIMNSYHVLCHKLQSISNEITGTQNYKISIECKPLYSQLQIFHFVTNCITVKSLGILLYSYHVFVPQTTKLLLNANSLFTVNYKIFITVKSSVVTNSFHS
jgi:hypothetical protein